MEASPSGPILEAPFDNGKVSCQGSGSTTENNAVKVLSLTAIEIARLRQFFRLLDSWDRNQSRSPNKSPEQFSDYLL